MGSCLSSSSANYIQEPVIKTSKIISKDGSLLEFSIPVKASTVLLGCDHDDSHTNFVCNSDRLNYDEYIKALREDEYIVPGEMYFVLPKEMLKKPLPGGDMAALAFKAASALSKAVFVETESRKGNKRQFVEDDGEGGYNEGSSSLRFRDGDKMKKSVRWTGKVRLSSIPE